MLESVPELTQEVGQDGNTGAGATAGGDVVGRAGWPGVLSPCDLARGAVVQPRACFRTNAPAAFKTENFILARGGRTCPVLKGA